MLRNCLKISVQNLLKHKLYSAINVLGLAVGLACSILIGLWVTDELSYDRFFLDADRIYRVSRDYYPGELGRVSGRYPASINAPFGPQLKADFPQVEEMARLFNVPGPIFKLGNTPVLESNLGFVDQSFVEMFSLTWLEGDAAGALSGPNSIVLTRALAEKYFPDGNALGGELTLVFTQELPLRVTGVFENLPGNTHFAFAALVSLNTLTRLSGFGPGILENWQSGTDYHTYIRLRPDARIEDLISQFPAFVDRYVGENASRESGISAMPLTGIHLYSTRTEELRPPGSISKVYAFILIAAGILLIACINFMNLSTARSSQRGREVGMRKVMGAGKHQLAGQFLGESLLMTLLAMGLALVLVELLLPAFSAFTGKSLDFAWLREAQPAAALAALVVVVGLVAGSYPAFFLSAFKPAQVLKGNNVPGRGNALFRQGLVVMQFAISIALVVATAVIHAQMNYARSIDLGLDREQVVAISGTWDAGLGTQTQWEAMKQELLKHPEVTQVTRSHYRPFTHDDSSLPVLREQGGGVEEQRIKYMSVDYDFFATYGIDLMAGRVFSADRGTDPIAMPSAQKPAGAGAFIINEAAARGMGWTPEEALKQSLWVGLGDGFRIPVIGVAEDSYFESLTTAIEPLIFLIPSPGVPVQILREGAVRVTGDNLEATLAYIDEVWREFLPDMPLSRHFLDEDFDALYRAERQQGEMLTWFTILATFIACLGLYGLARFNAERRTREIGVRKVMGGSVWSIVLLLTNDFSKLVLLANVIAWPVAWFAMSRWLENFAYRMDLTPMIFIGSGLIALCIAWVTVGGTAARAAGAKPVLALRYE